MKNTITIDKNLQYVPIVSSEDTGTNEIWLVFLNIPDNGYIDVYYGCDYRQQYQISAGVPWLLPEIYCSDGDMVKFRWYLDEEEQSGFISLVGDESLYKNLVIAKKSNTLLVCDGSLKPIKTDYTLELAKLISNHTGATSKYCYEDLLLLRNTMVGILTEKGVDIDANATIEDISKVIGSLNGPKSYIELNGTIISKGHYLYFNGTQEGG